MSVFAHVMRGLGSVEAIITLFLLTVWALAFFAPDPAMPSIPRYMSHTESSITVEWDAPLHGCGNVTSCAYELAFRLDGSQVVVTVPGTYIPVTDTVTETVTGLAQGLAYRFKVRHAVYHMRNQSWVWNAFTEESEQVFTSGQRHGQAHAERQHSAGRGRGRGGRQRREEQGGVRLSLKDRMRGMSLIVTKGARSLFYVISTLPLLWFAYRLLAPEISFGGEDIFQRLRSNVPRRVLAVGMALVWALAAVWVQEAREYAVVVAKGGVCASLAIALCVMLQRLQWQCRSFDWPPLSDPVGFSLTSTLLLFMHLLACKRLFGTTVKGEAFVLVSAVLWFVVNAVLIALSAVVQRVVEAHKKKTATSKASSRKE